MTGAYKPRDQIRCKRSKRSSGNPHFCVQHFDAFFNNHINNVKTSNAVLSAINLKFQIAPRTASNSFFEGLCDVSHIEFCPNALNLNRMYPHQLRRLFMNFLDSNDEKYESPMYHPNVDDCTNFCQKVLTIFPFIVSHDGVPLNFDLESEIPEEEHYIFMSYNRTNKTYRVSQLDTIKKYFIYRNKPDHFVALRQWYLKMNNPNEASDDSASDGKVSQHDNAIVISDSDTEESDNSIIVISDSD